MRQMCSALLNNFSLVLSDVIASKTAAGVTAVEMSDETTQILFGALDGLQDETSQVCVFLLTVPSSALTCSPPKIRQSQCG